MAARGDRVHYFDYLRLFAMLGVILMHEASGLLRSELTLGWFGVDLLTSLAFTAVPLFFMMSGALLLSRDETADLDRLWKKRLPKLLVPLLFWSVISVFWLWHTGAKTLEEIPGAIASALNDPVYVHLWYLYTLAGFYLLSPLLRRMVQALDRRLSRYLLLLMAAVVLLDIILPLVPGKYANLFNWWIARELKFFDGHLFAFLLGYYLHRTERRFPTPALAAAAALLLAAITLGTWWKTTVFNVYHSGFQTQNGGYELVLAACIFLLAKNLLQQKRPPLPIRTAVALSMPIYLMHLFIISFLWQFDIGPTRFILLLPCTALVFVISLLIAKTITSIPGLCYLSSGMRFSVASAGCNWIFTFRTLREARRKHKNRMP